MVRFRPSICFPVSRFSSLVSRLSPHPPPPLDQDGNHHHAAPQQQEARQRKYAAPDNLIKYSSTRTGRRSASLTPIYLMLLLFLPPITGQSTCNDLLLISCDVFFCFGRRDTTFHLLPIDCHSRPQHDVGSHSIIPNNLINTSMSLLASKQENNKIPANPISQTANYAFAGEKRSAARLIHPLIVSGHVSRPMMSVKWNE